MKGWKLPTLANGLVRRDGDDQSNRPLDLSINAQRVGSVAFAPTGSWTTWRTVTARVTLAAGRNRVRLTAVGSSGANIDSMLVAPVATT